MSARLRQFSVLPAALANISGDQHAASPSQLDHGSPLVASRGAAVAGHDHRCAIRNRRRPWIVAAGQVPATVPMWNSRSSWLAQLEAWRNLNREMLRQHHMSGRLFRRIMAALARYADGASGRHCAVSNKTVAKAVGCDRRSVSTARAILAASGYGIEVRRGSGSPGKPSHWCRNSVWHLISRRPSAAETGFCALPRPRTLPSKTPVGNHSPSETRSASPTNSLHKRRRRTGAGAPYDLQTQRIAGWLASTGIGMEARSGRHVVGQLCAALEGSHLQLDAWNGPTLIQALNADMVKRNRAVVMLVIDVSQSMNATDEPHTRLRAAQAAATRFAQELTPGINLGLISFAGNVNLLVSPTPDHQATIEALTKLQTDEATATGEAIFTALQSIQTVLTILSTQDTTPPPARIVLLSDGEENRPANPDNPRGAFTAARSAADQKVPISTIALGTKSGYVKLKDQRIPTPADDTQMKRIAELSGGQSYRAADIDALQASYTDVLEQVGYQTVNAPAGTAWLRLGVLAITLAAIAALVIHRTLPA